MELRHLPLLFIIFYLSQNAIAQKKYRSLENALRNPAEATELILNGSQDYKILPLEIAKLTNLKVLKLYGCGIVTLAPVIGQLKNLEVLDLGGNYLKTLPAEICNLKNLRDLSLHRNQLTELPDEIGNMENLTQLDLAYNKLTSLPLSFYWLKNLYIVNLQYNELTFISPWISRFSDLEFLNISMNKLENIPDKIWFTPKLYYMNLYKCGAMLSLPKDICSIPASSVKPRAAYIDSWHTPTSIVLPNCPYGDGGVRNGWYINIID